MLQAATDTLQDYLAAGIEFEPQLLKAHIKLHLGPALVAGRCGAATPVIVTAG